MSKKVLTQRFIETVQPPAHGRAVYADAALPGFRLRVSSNGVKTFSVIYRVNGRQFRETIGRWPQVGLAAARERARDSFKAVARGVNPHAEKVARRGKKRGPDTVRNLSQRYIEARKLEMRSWPELERLFKLHVWPEIGDRMAADVMPRDVFDLIAAIVKSGSPVQANRVLSALKTFFGWCVSEFILTANPAVDVKKPTKEAPRERVLSDDELRAVLLASKAAPYPFGPIVRLLIYTGCRRDEVADLAWPEIIGEEWLIPASRMKGKRQHLVPLTMSIRSLLDELPRFDGDFAFTTTAGARPFTDFVAGKTNLDEASGVSDWTLHDLRRTVGTGLARLGFDRDIRGRVLAHAQRDTVTDRVYNVYDFAAEKRRALEAWAQYIDELLRPLAPKIVPFPQVAAAS